MKWISRIGRCAGVLAISACVLHAPRALPLPPHLYADPTHQSPVRGAPDDLLLLPGTGLSANNTVVYREIVNATMPLTPPATMPDSSTAESGIAPVVSASEAPESLTIRLPQQIQPGQSYAIWVHDEDRGWSNAVRINDARPLWITPAKIYSTRRIASLPRYLKVVGRNLNASSGATTRVRLSGPAQIVLHAFDDHDPTTTVEEFVANVHLPRHLAPGRYTVDVSRDGHSWVSVPDQTLLVSPDPAIAQIFPVAAQGCVPDDGADDIRCVVSAIRAAQQAGGGSVVFGPGTWLIGNSKEAGVTFRDGILVPVGVNMSGAGASRTTILTGAQWSPDTRMAVFTLQGRNRIRGIRFGDARAHLPGTAPPGPTLQLGKIYYRVDPQDPNEPRSVEDVMITRNVFDRTHVAVGDGGLPIARLYVTFNEFGAYATGLSPAGDRFNVATPFRLDDSVIVHNVFKPGGYLDVPIAQGTIAAALGASFRVDFSNNIADGAATDYLNADDARGWRAAFFWHLSGNHEMLLVSRNLATCTGDKAGDGEAFSYDNNGNTFAFPRAQAVLDSSSNTVTTNNALAVKQNGRDVAVASYYVGHWLQVGEGPGAGQSRKIQSYSIEDGRVTFTVAPAWDVIPEPGAARVTIGRQYWQVYTVDNRVDHRTPTCLKSNRTKPKGGVIVLWAQTADSVVSGNLQFDTDGILVNQAYSAEDAACPTCKAWTMQQSFVEIRDNVIDGEYDWNSDCSLSGIQAWNGASPTPGSTPVVASFGVSIAHNLIRRADGHGGGAITVPLGWHQGPAPHDWKVVSDLLVHHNRLVDIDGPPPSKGCANARSTRIGIALDQADLVWDTVLYANKCTNVSRAFLDSGRQTRRICTPQLDGACECEN